MPIRARLIACGSTIQPTDSSTSCAGATPAWDAAARYLHLPDPFTNDAYKLTSAKLRSTDRFVELAGRVKRIANRHARRGLIDYKQRRSASNEPPRPHIRN